MTGSKRTPRGDLAMNGAGLERLLAKRLGDEITIAAVRELKRTPRRIVARYELAAPHGSALIGKWFSTDRGAVVFDALTQLRALGFDDVHSVPKPVAYLPEERALFVQCVDGRLLRDVMGERPSTASGAGAWLARFHGARFDSPRRCGPDKQRSAVRRWSQELPALGEAGRDLERALEALPDPQRPVHYDYYHSQMLVRPDTSIVVLDLDEAGLGDPAFDVAHFGAHLRLLSVQWFGDPDRFEPVEAAFLGGYESTAKQPPVHPALTAFAWFKLVYQLLKAGAPEVDSAYAREALRVSLSAC